MSDAIRRPSLVTADQTRLRSVTADDGFRIGTLIDATSHDSPLLLGLAWIEPATEVVWWSADERTHETYYLVSGRLRVIWEGEQPGEALLEPEDSFYFPPARRYGVENVGPDQVFIVWSLTPSERS